MRQTVSYASAAQTRGGWAMIRLLENTTGRRRLLRRARGVEDELASGANVFDVMVARYGLDLEVVRGRLENIPREGPVIVIANHPYGILDGLMMGHVLARRRQGFKIIANSVFGAAPDVAEYLLPVSFEKNAAAQALNIRTRREALSYLGQGGAVGIFPGGTVSTGAQPFAHPMDPQWRSFTARMIAKSGATVVPLYFDGHTSRMFQIASHMHMTLRIGLLLREFHSRLDTPVQVAIGAPIPREALASLSQDAKGMMDFLRKATYELAPEPLKSFEAGYEFEDRHKGR